MSDSIRLKRKNPKIDKDIKDLENKLINQHKGNLLQGFGDLKIFKIRQKNSSSNVGSSGGFRIIYHHIEENNLLIMLTIYSKTNKENVCKSEILEILKGTISLPNK